MTELSDWIIAGGDPDAVELARFEAWPEGTAIHVAWETVSEVDTAGFNLYRGESAGGGYERLNEALIPAQAPGSPDGAVYGWIDGDGLAAGQGYYYWLEVVDLHGHGQIFGPATATAGGRHRIYLPLAIE